MKSEKFFIYKMIDMKTYASKKGILPISISLVIILVLGWTILLTSSLSGKILMGLLLFAAVLTGTYFFILQIKIHRDHLEIQSLLCKKKISFQDIKAVAVAHPKVSFYTPSSMNVFNSRGFFGFVGKTPDGNISYATSMNNQVWIQLKNDEQILVCLQNHKDFVREVQLYLKE